MSNAYIELSIAGLTVRFDRFVNDTLPRIEPQLNSAASVNYTASGVAVIAKPAFEVPNYWDIEAPCTREKYETLKLIYTECNHQIENNGSYNILVTDTTQLEEERGSRTRAIAPSTTEIVRAPYVLYYARYYAVMLAKPQFKLQGNGYVAKFFLEETDRTTP